MDMKHIKLTTADPNILIIELDRPESMNALNSELVGELSDVIEAIESGDDEAIESGDDIRAVIVTGKGNFAAGADISEMVDLNKSGAFDFAFGKVFDRLAKLKVPTIAAINGYALGGGMELALCCDLRIASKDAKMGLPEITLGIFPGAGGTVRLSRIIGEGRAKEMILIGKPVDAEKAEQIGLVNFVVDGSELEESALKIAGKLAKGPAVALKNAKMSIAGSADPGQDSLDHECELWCELFETEDQKEGMKAFLEKRKPEYKGK